MGELPIAPIINQGQQKRPFVGKVMVERPDAHSCPLRNVCHGRRLIAMLCKVLLCSIKHSPTRDKATGLRAPRANPRRRRTLSGHFAILSGRGIRRKAPQRARRGADRTKCDDPRECRHRRHRKEVSPFASRSGARTPSAIFPGLAHAPTAQQSGCALDQAHRLCTQGTSNLRGRPGSRSCRGNGKSLVREVHRGTRGNWVSQTDPLVPRKPGFAIRSLTPPSRSRRRRIPLAKAPAFPRCSSMRSLLIAPARGAAPQYEGPVRFCMISPAPGDTEVKE